MPWQDGVTVAEDKERALARRVRGTSMRPRASRSRPPAHPTRARKDSRQAPVAIVLLASIRSDDIGVRVRQRASAKCLQVAFSLAYFAKRLARAGTCGL